MEKKIMVHGCDDSTGIEMEMTEEQFAFLKDFAAKVNEIGEKVHCKPTIPCRRATKISTLFQSEPPIKKLTTLLMRNLGMLCLVLGTVGFVVGGMGGDGFEIVKLVYSASAVAALILGGILLIKQN